MVNFVGSLNRAVNPQTFAPQLNISIGGVYTLALAPGNIPNNGTGVLTTATATGLGLRVNDFVRVSLQGTQTPGIIIGDSWVSGVDILNVQFANVTGTAVAPVNGIYDVLVLRPDTSISQEVPAIQP